MKKFILTIFLILSIFLPNITYALTTSISKNYQLNSGSTFKIRLIFLHIKKQYQDVIIHWNNIYYNKPSLLKQYGVVRVKNFSFKITKKHIYNISNIKTFSYPAPILKSNGQLITYKRYYQKGIQIKIALSNVKNGIFYNGLIIIKRLIKFNHYKFYHKTYKLPVTHYTSFSIAGKVLYSRISYAGKEGYKSNIVFVLIKLRQ